jgi:hypothetical protein
MSAAASLKPSETPRWSSPGVRSPGATGTLDGQQAALARLASSPQVDGVNCYTGNEWDATLCPDGETCAAQCALEGADYANTYGITTAADELTLDFVTEHAYGTNVGSRVYLMEDDKYMLFQLKNKEFSLTVDDSQLGCGLNGAVYFVSWPTCQSSPRCSPRLG